MERTVHTEQTQVVYIVVMFLNKVRKYTKHLRSQTKFLKLKCVSVAFSDSMLTFFRNTDSENENSKIFGMSIFNLGLI
jgi:heme O synthase-like polyprenyltransferase